MATDPTGKRELTPLGACAAKAGPGASGGPQGLHIKNVLEHGDSSLSLACLSGPVPST